MVCAVSILQILPAVLDFYCYTFWSCLKHFTIGRVAYFALNSLQLKLKRHKKLRVVVVKTANSSAVKIKKKGRSYCHGGSVGQIPVI